MSTISALVARTRTEIGDTPKLFEQNFTTTGGTNAYPIGFSPLAAGTLTVTLDGVVVQDEPIEDVEYSGVSVDESTGLLIFDFMPPEGLELRITGTYFRFFTDAELASIVKDSLAMHIGTRTDASGRPITLARLDGIEEYPVALLSTINALYVLVTDASFDIDIYAPDGVNIPRSQRYRQLMELIEELKNRYKELCSMLNIGMYKIEVYTLRRISKRTNRYVPVYFPQEIDDRNIPQRVRLPLPTYGGTVIDDGMPTWDFVAPQGIPFDHIITKLVQGSPLDLTGYTAKMQVRRSVNDPDAVLTLTDGDGLTLGGPDGTVTIHIDASALTNLPYRTYVYDLEVYSPDAVPTRLVRGDFTVTPEVTR